MGTTAGKCWCPEPLSVVVGGPVILGTAATAGKSVEASELQGRDANSTEPSAAASGGEVESVERGSAHRKYVEKASLLKILRKEGKSVRLVKPEYLIELYEKSEKPIARRQELPEEAFLDVEALSEKEIGDMVIVAISYCWISKGHPDPQRYHLKTLWALLKIYMNSTSLIGEHPEDGGKGFTVGVFLDWSSLFQEPRDEEKTRLFRDALKSINSWYAHSETLVWKLTSLPEDIERVGYAESGWPFFEAAVAGIVKPWVRICTIDASAREEYISAAERWNGPFDSWRWKHMLTEERKPTVVEITKPLEPKFFDSQVESKNFTNGADCDCVVKPLYQKTFHEVIRDGIAFDVQSSPVSGGEALEALHVWANYCHSLRTIKIFHCQNMDMKLADLVGALSQNEGRAAGLQTLELSYNKKLAGSPVDLAPLVGLRVLTLRDCPISGEISDLARLASLRDLTLNSLHGLRGDIASLSQHATLQMVMLSQLRLSFDVSSLSQFVELRHLHLEDLEGLRGDVAGLGQLAKLETLALIDLGGLSGDIISLGQLSKLRSVKLSNMHGLSGVKFAVIHPGRVFNKTPCLLTVVNCKRNAGCC